MVYKVARAVSDEVRSKASHLYQQASNAITSMTDIINFPYIEQLLHIKRRLQLSHRTKLLESSAKHNEGSKMGKKPGETITISFVNTDSEIFLHH